MRFGKLKMFFILHGIVAFILLCYFGPWIFSRTVTGRIVQPLNNPTTITVEYKVDGKIYSEEFMRNGIHYAKKTVPLRYLSFNPSTARVRSFMGMWAEPLAWWLVFLLATSMLLLTNNAVFSKGTVFQLHKKFPWISMEEYFPVRIRSNWWRRNTTRQPRPEKEEMKEENFLLK